MPLLLDTPGGSPEEKFRFLVSQIDDGKWGVNEADCRGETPLLNAIWGGFKNGVLELKIRGVDFEHKDHCGFKPIHHAARGDSPDMVKYLIELGAKPDLMTAVMLGDRPFAEEMFKKGYSPTETWPNGITPLHVAAMRGDLSMSKWILEKTKGVIPKYPVRPKTDGSVAKWIFARGKAPKIPTRRTSMCSIAGAVGLFGYSPGNPLDHALQYATWNQKDEKISPDHLAVAHFLLSAGMSPSKEGFHPRFSVLDAPVDACDMKLVNTLLVRGVPPTWKTGPYPHVAAQRCAPEMLKILREHGARFDLSDEYGLSVYQSALRTGNKPVLNWLAKKGLKSGRPLPPKAAQNRLAEAIDKGNLEKVRLALKEGADADLGYLDCCNTMLAQALDQDNLAIIEALLKAGANPNKPVRRFHENIVEFPLNEIYLDKDIGKIRLLLRYGANLSLARQSKKNLVKQALGASAPNLALFWLQKGLDPLEKDGEPGTVMDWFLVNAPDEPEELRIYAKLLAVLVHKGISVNERDSQGDTPLHFACSRQRGNLAKLLISLGANKYAKNKNGLTPDKAFIKGKCY